MADLLQITGSFALFKGLSADDTDKALKLLGAEKRRYIRGEALNRPSEPLDRFGLVLDGCVQVFQYDASGDTTLMASVESGKSFGESLNYLGIPAHVFINAAVDTEVLCLDIRRLSHRTGDHFEIELLERFTALLARKTLEMNNRIQMLSKLTIRDKLMTFFLQCELSSGNNEFTIPFDREQMSVYLGVNRSSLSRELSAMKKDGIIDFSKNRIRLLRS